MRHASQDKVGIYLVAANRLLREALARVLCDEAGFNVVGACSPDQDAEYAVLASGARVVLLNDFGPARSDLQMLKKLMNASLSLRVILVGMPESERAFVDSVVAGAVGYLLDDASTEDLISTVRAVLNGESTCPSRMIVSLYKYVRGNGNAYPEFAFEYRPAAYAGIPAPRALHFFS